MYGKSVAEIKSGKRGCAQDKPREGTQTHDLYVKLMRDGFVVVGRKERLILEHLNQCYGIVTRSVGKKKYVLDRIEE